MRKLAWAWLLIPFMAASGMAQSQPLLMGENVENPSAGLVSIRNTRFNEGNIAVDLGFNWASIVSQNILFGARPLVDILNVIFAPSLFIRVAVFARASVDIFSLIFKLRSDLREEAIEALIRSFEILN